MRSDRIGLGIIGLGSISPAHEAGYQQVADKAEIVAVCDLNEAAARQMAEPHQAKVYTDYGELLQDPRVDVVDIILPHHLHYPVALEAIAHKKHVSVEKPLAMTAEQALAVCEKARAEGVKLTVAENTRFVTAYIEAAKLIEEGALGGLRLLRTFISGSEVDRLTDPTNWKGNVGGGAILDAGPHSFYLIKWLAGEIEDMQTFAARLVKEAAVEDNAIVTGRLKSGGLFTTEYSFTVEAPWSERLEIYGSQGSLIIDQLCDPPARYFRGKQDFDPQPLTRVPHDPIEWKRRSIAAGAADFVGAIWEGRAPTVDPMDGYYALKVIEKAYESLTSGKPTRV